MANEWDSKNVRQSTALNKPGAGLDRLMGSMTGQHAPEPQTVEVEKIVEVLPGNALVYLDNGDISFGRCVITPVGLVMPDDVTDEELMAVGRVMDSLETALDWNRADWFNRADNRVWGQMYQTAEDLSGEIELKYNTQKDYAWIARNVELSIRNRQLSFTHHRLVAPLVECPNLQHLWLVYSATRHLKPLTVAQMRREMEALKSLTLEDCTRWLQWAIDNPKEILSKREEFKVERQKPVPNWKEWRNTTYRVQQALRGNLNLTHDEFEDELRRFANQARVMWASRNRNE